MSTGEDEGSSELMEGVELLNRRELQRLCDFELPSAPKWQLGKYTPPGPIGAQYIDSEGPIDAIMGPGGSGKTVASAWKGVKFALQRMPICVDGIIRCKGTVVRDNYRSLYRTTLQSWFDIFPPGGEDSQFSGGQDRPAVHVLRLSTVRNIHGVNKIVPVDLRVEFFAIADINYELLFKSYETSYAWATEADGVDPMAIPFFYSRTSRFPRLSLLPPGVQRVRVAFVDFNPPDPEHPLYLACVRGSFREDFDEAKEPRTINFFKQPSGLSDQAENRMGKSKAEYEAEAAVLHKDTARRMVEGRPGRQRSGLPVYDEDFDYDVHTAVNVGIIRDLPLNIGMDQGGQGGSAGSPAAVFFQVLANGQARFYDEVVAETGTGVERFLEHMIPLMTTRFVDLSYGVWSCDPSGFYGGDKVYGTLAFAEIIQKALKHPMLPAPSNEWTPRRESLALLMGRNISAGVPKIIIDRRCKLLIKGLNGGYKYSRRHDGTYDPRPIKNREANAVEAAQYGVLGVFGLQGTINRLAQVSRPSEDNVVQMRRRAGQRRPSDFSVWDV